MMSNNFDTFFDCGYSKIRAGVFNKNNEKEAFYAESEFFTDQSNLELKIQKIVTFFEKNIKEYINNINLMVDSTKMFSIGVSVSKKLDGSKLKKSHIQFLVQDAKQQILKHYISHNIAHIIINNYNIDGAHYANLPDETECNFISLDILFICLPSDLVLFYKKIFSKSNISINQIICSSYAKSINYKNSLNITGSMLFIDIGFNKSSIITYFNNKIISVNILPVGGNDITKDISKVLGIDLNSSERIKLEFSQNQEFLNEINFSLDKLQKIIFARFEEILDLCIKSSVPNFFESGQFKIALMGEGSKILYNQYKNKIFFLNDTDFMNETLESICQSGFKFEKVSNKQEVVMVAKKQIKQGFFEKLFHFFS